MECFTGVQYYPKPEKTFMQRIRSMINAYYEDEASIPLTSTAVTPEDDVARLSNSLATFPGVCNEYADKELVEEVAGVLPEDDAIYLTEKHQKQCKEALEKTKRAIKAIETYAFMTQTPHLFTKEETNNLSDENTLKFIVSVIADVYGEEQVGFEAYVDKLKESEQRLDNTLLSLDYDS